MNLDLKYKVLNDNVHFIMNMIKKGGREYIVNCRTPDGCSLLMFSKSAKVTRLLIQFGCNVNIRSDIGSFALKFAKNAKMVRLLINAGADVNAQTNVGTTALMSFSSIQDNLEMIKMISLLIKAGADVNAVDIYNNSTLLYYHRNIEISELLIEAGSIADFKMFMILKPIIIRVCLRRIFEICVGLQSLELSALELLAIVDESNPNMVHLTMKQKWDAITKIKHFHSEQKSENL